MQTVASAVTAPLNVWFLDDGTLGGDTDGVCADLQLLIPAMARIGLEVNPSKCEIITPSTGAAEQSVTPSTGAAEHSVNVEKLHQLLPGAAVLADTEQLVPGAPLTTSATVTALGKKKDELDRLLSRL